MRIEVRVEFFPEAKQSLIFNLIWFFQLLFPLIYTYLFRTVQKHLIFLPTTLRIFFDSIATFQGQGEDYAFTIEPVWFISLSLAQLSPCLLYNTCIIT